MIERDLLDDKNKIMQSVFSQRFDYIMSIRDVKNQDLAEAIFVAPSTVSGWRIGRRQPDLYKLTQISRYLKVSTDYLLGISNDSSVIRPCENRKKTR